MMSAQASTACQAMATRDIVKPAVSFGTKPLLPVRSGVLGRKGATFIARAEGQVQTLARMTCLICQAKWKTVARNRSLARQA